MPTQDFIEENIHDYLFMRYAVKERLFSGKSKFQKVEIVDTVGHGRMLLNDDLVMITERDEHIYHEMIVHVPMFVHPNPQNVLVIGGGDGGTVREVLRHKQVKKCTLVEIDEMVVDACKKHIPQTSACLSDPRAKVLIEDGVKFLAETKEKFDVIIIDSTDPIGPAAPLFGPEFYANVHKALTNNGISVSQGESPFYHEENQTSLVKIISKQFPVKHLYNFTNMTYPGCLWSFAYASKGLCPVENFDPLRVQRSGMQFKYYNEEVHIGAFLLQEFMRKRYNDYLTPFHDHD
jgi:spermidine synthase